METLEYINYHLEKTFGKFEDSRPNWRVVWANDQTEVRRMDVTDDGIDLIHPEYRLVKKYQYSHDRYVLERLVPVVGETDLTTKTSYEPAWTFQDRHGAFLPPYFEGCKFLIEAIYAQTDKANTHVKYKDPEIDKDFRAKQLLEMEQKLFGDETPGIADSLHYKEGVSYAGLDARNAQAEVKDE